MIEIKVKNSGIVFLQHFDDRNDGVLTIGESERSVPFKIQRIYYINNLKKRTAVRGKHAHKKQNQIIFCVNGSFVLNLDDGSKKQSITMNNPYMGIKLDAMLWHEMTDFSPDCVILVLADDYYDANDYIRNYEDFLSLVK
ncbi:MAG: FdtA/QdtA family cupin domain-containing protein [Candidatus Paceibacterota bacterium]|jgi:dTDP-4-dehydrorhamnose 3,5-epimerase-like enzyme